jgi:hypothetical protein
MSKCPYHPHFDGWKNPPEGCETCSLLHEERHDKEIAKQKEKFSDVYAYFLRQDRLEMKHG